MIFFRFCTLFGETRLQDQLEPRVGHHERCDQDRADQLRGDDAEDLADKAHPDIDVARGHVDAVPTADAATASERESRASERESTSLLVDDTFCARGWLGTQNSHRVPLGEQVGGVRRDRGGVGVWGVGYIISSWRPALG